MVLLSTIVRKRCKPDAFVRMARIILGDSDKYEDDLIEIRWFPRRDDKYLEITRKPIKSDDGYDSFSGDNPTTMEVNGKIIRHHGEHTLITTHMEKLVEAKGELPYLNDTTNEEDDDE
jgi:hypothetical protein